MASAEPMAGLLVLDIVEEEWTRTGVAPSVREIMALLGWRSTSVVQARLRWLVEAGMLEAVGDKATTRRYVPKLERRRELLGVGGKMS